MQITITEEIKKCTAGVYAIEFSDGNFYIGSSKDVPSRIKTHIRSINSDFKNSATCRALKIMNGFDGDIKIRLLESIDTLSATRMDAIRIILSAEAKHILLYSNDLNCLNWNKKAYGKRAIDVKCLNG